MNLWLYCVCMHGNYRRLEALMHNLTILSMFYCNPTLKMSTYFKVQITMHHNLLPIILQVVACLSVVAGEIVSAKAQRRELKAKTKAVAKFVALHAQTAPWHGPACLGDSCRQVPEGIRSGWWLAYRRTRASLEVRCSMQWHVSYRRCLLDCEWILSVKIFIAGGSYDKHLHRGGPVGPEQQ